MTPIREGGKSAPSLSLAPPLETQDVSRFQAVNTSPEYWGEKAPPIRWSVFAVIAAVAMVIALVIVAPYAMHWPQWWKVAIAVPVAALGIVALRWIR